VVPLFFYNEYSDSVGKTRGKCLPYWVVKGMNNSGAILEKKGLGIFATGLSGNNLKIIAIVAMTVDHLAWTFFPGYTTDPLPIFMHVI
jgi:hypothetical protein